MATLEELKQWCDTSRKLLKTKKNLRQSKQTATLKNGINNALSRLREMEGQKPLIRIYQKYLGEFEALQKELDVDAKKNERAKESVRNDMQLLFASRFDAIAQNIAQEISGKGLKPEILPDQKKEFEALSKARGAFATAVEDAKIQIRDELTRDLSDKHLLNGALKILGTWEEEVKKPSYEDPNEVDKLRKQIKPLLADLIKDKTKESTGKRKDEEAQSKARGGAEQRLKEVEALLKELTDTGQLVPSIGVEMSTAIEQAKARFVQGDWIGGDALLKPLPKRSRAVKAFETARVEAGIVFTAELEQMQIALGGLKTYVDTATLQRFETATRQLQGSAGDPAPKPMKDSIKLLQDFKALIAQMKEELRFAVSTASSLTSLVKTLGEKRKELKKVVPLNRDDEHGRQLELIEVLRSDRRWKEALDTANMLQASLQRQDTPDFAKWELLGRELRERGALNNPLRMAVITPDATPALQQGAQDLLNQSSTAQLARLEEARDWTSLVALHTAVKKFNLGLVAEIQKYKDFASARQDADGVIQLRITRCTSELDGLQRALVKAGAESAPVLKPIQDNLGQLKAEWARRMANATDNSGLNRPQMEDELNLAMQGIISANCGPTLKETVDGQRDVAGQAAFKQALAKLESESLGPLAALSFAMADGFRQEISRLTDNKEIDTDPAAPWAQRLQLLEVMAGRVATGITAAQRDCEDLNRALTGKADAVALVLRAAREELKSKGFWASLEARYEPMFADLEQELSGLRQLLTTTNATAANGNRALLESLKTRADKIVLLAKANKGLDGREGRVTTAGERLEALRKDKLGKLAAETDKSLGEQLAAMKRDMFGMEPDVMTQEIETFGKALAAARLQLDGIKEQQAKVEQLKVDLKLRIGKLQSKKAALTYYAKLLERLDSAVEQGKAVDQLGAAITALEVIGTEVTQAEADPNAALKRQTAVNSEEHAKTRLKQEYEGRLSAVKDRVLPRAKLAVKAAGGDEDQINEVNRMVEMAVKAAKKGNHERAIQILVQTENRVVEVEKNPAGTALGDRNALPKHVETFATQMGQLRDDLSGFVEAALDVAPEGAREALRKPLNDAVQNAKAQLNPRVFDPYISTIVDSSKPMAERRSLRDQALQRLRELSAYISGHPTLAKLAVNPIRPLQGAVRLVDSSLVRLEAHLRAAIKSK